MKRFMTFFLTSLFAFASFCYANDSTALLRYNLEEGQTYTYDGNVKIKIDPKLEGQDEISFSFQIKYAVKEVLPDGSIRLGYSIHPILDNLPEKLAEGYARVADLIKDFELLIEQTPRGKITDVLNIDEMIHKVYGMTFYSYLDDADSDERQLEYMIDYLDDEIGYDLESIINKINSSKEQKTISAEDLKYFDSALSFCDEKKIEGEKLLEKTNQFKDSLVDIENFSDMEKETLLSLKEEIQKVEKEIYMQRYTIGKISETISQKEMLKEVLNDQTAFYPELPVKAGDYWISTYKSSKMKTELSTLIVVTDVNDQTATLEQKFLPIQLCGTSVGFNNTICIDKATGMTSTQKLVLSVSSQQEDFDFDDDEDEDEDEEDYDPKKVDIEILLNLVK